MAHARNLGTMSLDALEVLKANPSQLEESGASAAIDAIVSRHNVDVVLLVRVIDALMLVGFGRNAQTAAILRATIDIIESPAIPHVEETLAKAGVVLEPDDQSEADDDELLNALFGV